MVLTVNVENWLTASPLAVRSTVFVDDAPDRRRDRDDVAIEAELDCNRLSRIVVQADQRPKLIEVRSP